MTTSVEFAVQISCDTCVNKIEKSLVGVEGVKRIQVSRDEGTVLVESTLPSSVIQEKLESTGRKAVLKGVGDQGEKEVYKFVKLEKDSDGCCPLCKPLPVKTEKDAETESKTDIEKSTDPQENIKKTNGNDDMEGDIDDLELKYSSDSEAGDHITSDLHMSEADEIWRIEDDLDADYDVIDADDTEHSEGKDVSKDGDTSKDEDTSKSDATKEKKKSPKKRSKNEFNNDLSSFLKKMKSSKIRQGEIDFNSNDSIAFVLLVVPENDDVKINESQAQMIKDQLLHEIVSSCQRVQEGKENSFILKVGDCKYVAKQGWVCIKCGDKETLDFLLNWKLPLINNKNFKLIPALDKAPLQTIKFSIKSHWVSDLDLMLKLIHLQNRDIDTKRWELVNRTPVSNSTMESFKFNIDFGSLVAIKKMDWSFFFELFPVKILEFNGKNVSALKSAGLKSAIPGRT